MGKRYYVHMQKVYGYKKMWEKHYGKSITNGSGIYVLTRFGEDEFRYAYVGQSVHVLNRLAQHSLGYEQHIDKSLREHKLLSKDRPYGWKLAEVISCTPEEMDALEKKYEHIYANIGYQLRNKTSGGQGEGKIGTSDNQGGLGYRKGVVAGYEKCHKDVVEYMKYMFVFPIENTVICDKKVAEFENEWLKNKKPE